MNVSQMVEESSVYTVSSLNAAIKRQLETSYRLVWVRGEISNFRVPASGHFYFTLKDAQSQLRGVMFKGQQRGLRFRPEDGLQVLCHGRISVYEPRGEYQLIVELMEPQGAGALQLAFEQTKRRLEAEGLFAAERKRPLPMCPQRIAVITSSTGAAIRDILKVLGRSPYPLSVSVLPVRVQGEEAAAEIAAALDAVSELDEEYQWDLVIFGRGGGSFEDLFAFNEEAVARAAARCEVVTVSAVGHEIDWTISDMVADMRAPTPTAAAEWVVARLEAIQRELEGHVESAQRLIRLKLDRLRDRMDHLMKRFPDPRNRLQDLRLYVDDRTGRLQTALAHRLERMTVRRAHLRDKLLYHHPARMVVRYRERLDRQVKELRLHMNKNLDHHRFRLQEELVRLDGYSPLAVLSRGYSITYRLPEGTVVRRAEDVAAGDEIKVWLAEGRLRCRVEAVEHSERNAEAGEKGSAAKEDGKVRRIAESPGEDR